MSRTKLTPEHKKAMQEARIVARRQRKEARQLVENNPQILNCKFWSKIDGELREVLESALQKVRDHEKAERIRDLEEELAELKDGS